MEGVYLIYTRELIALKLNIFKLGRSNILTNRVRQYPKGSQILFIFACENSVSIEKHLIELFKTKFHQETYYGTEYFSGNKNIMIEEIFNYIFKTLVPRVENVIVPRVENVIVPRVDEVENVNTISNSPKSNKTCPKCKTIFKYPSILKAHMKNAFHCILTDNEIQKYFNKNTNIECITCNRTFSRISVLKRHNLESKCGKLQEAKTIQAIGGIKKLSIEQLKLLYPNQTHDFIEEINNINL